MIQRTHQVADWVAFVLLQEEDSRRQRKILANMISLVQVS